MDFPIANLMSEKTGKVLSMTRYLSASQAADLLGVSKATLYAYVSRGLIRSEEIGASSRARRYLAEDVRRLKARKTYRRNPAQVAQDALHWGSPLLEFGADSDHG